MNGFLAAMLPVVAIWLLSGLATAYVMGRRGHDPGAWMVLGVVAGPFAVIFAVPRALEGERAVQPLRSAPGVPTPGQVDVLVGIDGSPESRNALRQACLLLGGRVRRLTLARVVDYQTYQKGEGEESARADLEEAAAMVAELRPEQVVLAGPAAEVLERHAREEGFGLLVVGTRGRGASKALVGSVASRLARRGAVPVLMAGSEAPADDSAPREGTFDPRDGGRPPADMPEPDEPRSP